MGAAGDGHSGHGHARGWVEVPIAGLSAKRSARANPLVSWFHGAVATATGRSDDSRLSGALFFALAASIFAAAALKRRKLARCAVSRGRPPATSLDLPRRTPRPGVDMRFIPAWKEQRRSTALAFLVRSQ